MRNGWRTMLTMVVVLSVVSPAMAHFLWLVPEPVSANAKVHVYFSDGAHPDRPELLDRVKSVRVWRLSGAKTFEAVEFSRTEDALCASLPANDSGSTYGLSHDYGISTKTGEPRRILFHAKAHTSADPSTWLAVRDAKRLPLEIVSARDGLKHVFTVMSNGQPLAKAGVTVTGPDSFKVTAETDDAGRVSFDLPQSGSYGLWTKLVDSSKGELDGKPFTQTTHLSTLTLPIEVIPVKKNTDTK